MIQLAGQRKVVIRVGALTYAKAPIPKEKDVSILPFHDWCVAKGHFGQTFCPDYGVLML